jgi:hypothetical protein
MGLFLLTEYPENGSAPPEDLAALKEGAMRVGVRSVEVLPDARGRQRVVQNSHVHEAGA